MLIYDLEGNSSRLRGNGEIVVVAGCAIYIRVSPNRVLETSGINWLKRSQPRQPLINHLLDGLEKCPCAARVTPKRQTEERNRITVLLAARQ